MNANPLFPRIVEEYKSHLRSQGKSPLSFRCFCRLHDVRPESVSQWMRRRNLVVETLRYEVMLEGYTVGSRSASKKENGEIVFSSSAAEKSNEPNYLKGVSITFPDGVQVSIRQGSACALIKFIRSYHHLTDRNYAQSE